MTAPSPSSPPDAAVFHPERLVAILGRFKVEYVLIGGIAARLQGFPHLTALAEIAPAIQPANFEALSVALKHLGARIHTDGTPQGLLFDLTADALAGAPAWKLVTSCGRLDIAFRPTGTDGFGDLSKRAVQFRLHGDTIAVASLDDLLRMKVAEREVMGGAGDIAILTELAKRANIDHEGV